jgi:hypothetical protein
MVATGGWKHREPAGRHELYGRAVLIDALRYVEDLDVIAQVRSSIIVYATVNGLHILGLATLVGAVLTFDIRASGPVEA